MRDDYRVEVLTFSKKQFRLAKKAQKELRDYLDPTFESFYEGQQFSDRRSINSEPNRFPDAKIVFKGVIEESKITYRSKKSIGLSLIWKIPYWLIGYLFRKIFNLFYGTF